MDTDIHDTDPVLDRAVASLRDALPGDDLWPTIAERMTPRVPRGTLLVRWPVALAAGLALAVISAGGTAIVVHARASTTSSLTVALSRDHLVATPASATSADTALVHAIRDMETAVRANVNALDPAARRSVTTGLAALDRAIAQATAEHQAAPNDPLTGAYLTSTLRRKLALLRTVSQLTRRQS